LRTLGQTLVPEAPAAAVNLGVLLAEQGQPEQAAAGYQQAIETDHPDRTSR